MAYIVSSVLIYCFADEHITIRVTNFSSIPIKKSFFFGRMMNYDIPQALGVPSSSASTSSNNNSHRVSPHSYYQASHHLHQAHHRLKNEPFSPPISHSTSNTRSSLNDSNHSPSKPPVLQSQRSADYGGSPPCSEPSLKHARFDSSVWPNPT